MTFYRYRAMPRRREAQAAASLITGELSGVDGADVRAQLRRVGLSVLEIKPIETAPSSRDVSPRFSLRTMPWFQRYLRQRRRELRSELFDALATMLESGMPMLESLDAMLRTRTGKAAALLLQHARERLKGGQSLAEAFAAEPTWFDPVEVARIEAGQRGGTLPSVLRSLADRHARAGQLHQKLGAALAYPTIVLVLGLGVVAFLATKTLPELVRMLQDAKLEPPALTVQVMRFGTLLTQAWWIAPIVFVTLVVTLFALICLLRSRGAFLSNVVDRIRPEVVRRMRVGAMAQSLAELVRTGVPLVESLRVLAPTTGSAALRDVLLRAADRLERGATVAESFEAPAWFDEEFSRLLEIGQATGELAPLLDRIGQRYERSAARAIDRLAQLLEPAAILLLAALVGTVALAAVLPLFQLQEIL